VWGVDPAVTETAEDLEGAAAIRILLGIARLGEADLEGWWSSQGLNRAVAFALAGFRRTGAIVGAELALLSATRQHERVLPRPTAVHLFSPLLPFARWSHAHLAELKSGRSSELIDLLRSWETVAESREELERWVAALRSGATAATRPTITQSELSDAVVRRDVLVQLASCYPNHLGPLDVPYVDLVP